jgi:hypothetical protein
MLTPGRRTICACLQTMGLAQDKHFQNYHRVLNRARWSAREAARLLLLLLIETFPTQGPLVLLIDETLERRRGAQIKAKGVYRDPTRSSKSALQKSMGLRWIVLALSTSLPWTERRWALPFLSVLAPSERYHRERGKRHKTITDWARQMIVQVRRWLPERELVVVGDGAYAALKLLHRCVQVDVTLVSRLRFDAALYEPAAPHQPGQRGRPRRKGNRLPTLEQRLHDESAKWDTLTVLRWYSEGERTVEILSDTAVWYHAGQPPVPLRWVLVRDPEGVRDPAALLCTNRNATPSEILDWFQRRWSIEVTFQEVRTHLGFETQRHWNDLAVQRTAPAMLALFSMVTLFAHQWLVKVSAPIRRTAWYVKQRLTFSDALALVRRKLWTHEH